MWAKARAVGNVYSRCPRAVPVRASASSTCPRPVAVPAGAVVLWVGRWLRPVAAAALRSPCRVWGPPVLRKLNDLSLSFEEVGPLG